MSKLNQFFYSDIALLKKYANGDTVAFETLYERHKDALFNYIIRSFAQRAIAEEIAQETWLRVIQQAGNYKPTGKFRTWLFRIAHNKLIDHHRRKGNNPTNHQNDQLDQISSPQTSPEDQILFRQLITALEQLPPPQRDAFILQQEGFTHSEIAAITSTSDETVKSRLRYARAVTRKKMGASL